MTVGPIEAHVADPLEVTLAPRRHSRHASRQFYAHLFLTVMVLGTTLIAGRPALLALAGPSLGLLFAALVLPRPDDIAWTASFDRRRGIEGDRTVLTTSGRSSSFAAADLSVELPPALAAQGPERHLVGMVPGRRVDFALPIEMTTWGISAPRSLIVRVSDGAGLLSVRHEFGCVGRLRTHLPDPNTRSLFDPANFLRIVGNHTSLRAGDGCELADVRPYRPGDRLRNLNWRISARFDEPWITERHPDRATAVVVVVDARRDAGIGKLGAFRRSVRFAMALAQSHLLVNDEVGLAIVGRKNRWIQPRTGRLQLERITETLLEINSEAEAGQLVPLELLVPADAVVVMVSSEMSEDLIDQARSLVVRGNVVHLVEPEIATYTPDERAAGPPGALDDFLYSIGFSSNDAWNRVVAARIFAVDREWRRRWLRADGFSVMNWRLDQPVESVILALRAAQRSRSVGPRSTVGPKSQPASTPPASPAPAP